MPSSARFRRDIADIRAFVVHAKDEEARGFYQKLNFIPSPADPMHLVVLLKDVRRITSGQSDSQTRAKQKNRAPLRKNAHIYAIRVIARRPNLTEIVCAAFRIGLPNTRILEA